MVLIGMARTNSPHKLPLQDPLREAAFMALNRVVGPLVDLMLDTGVTVRELGHLVRESAVRTAARRVSNASGRESKSRVAIITGLPRSEVAKILKNNYVSPTKRLRLHPSRRVLAAWFDDPRFLTADGDPAVLPIFGSRRSFERLVALYSRGSPVRAMLDELTQIDAVERLSDQRVRAKSGIPIFTGLTGGAIAAVGERTGDLLLTLTNNLRRKSNPLFVGTAVVEETDLEMVALIRREIAEQGLNFINSANSLLNRSRAKPSRSISNSSVKCRLGATVYYFQDDVESGARSRSDTTFKRRKNLQRKRRSVGKRTAPGQRNAEPVVEGK